MSVPRSVPQVVSMTLLLIGLLGSGAASAAQLPAPAGSPEQAVSTSQPAPRVLHGITIGPDGQPAADVPIALHLITETGGALVEEVASGVDGRFTIAAPDGPEDALYFVAARYEGELYIGPTFRPPFPTDSEYVVQVGVEETSAARMARGVSPDAVFVRPPASPWRWGIAFAVFVTLALVVTMLLLRARGPQPRRRILIRIAELDEDHEVGGADGAADDEYVAQRTELIERLRALG